MLKKIMFTFLTLLMVYSVSVVSYRIFEPSDNTNTIDTSSFLAYDSLKSYVTEGSSSVHYFFFYSANDTNSIYLYNTVFSTVNSDTNKDVTSLIEVVDVSELDTTLDITRLYEDWGVSSYPSFVAVSVENGEITINNKLEWTNEKSITATDIENWLQENGLI